MPFRRLHTRELLLEAAEADFRAGTIRGSPTVPAYALLSLLVVGEWRLLEDWAHQTKITYITGNPSPNALSETIARIYNRPGARGIAMVMWHLLFCRTIMVCIDDQSEQEVVDILVFIFASELVPVRDFVVRYYRGPDSVGDCSAFEARVKERLKQHKFYLGEGDLISMMNKRRRGMDRTDPRVLRVALRIGYYLHE